MSFEKGSTNQPITAEDLGQAYWQDDVPDFKAHSDLPSTPVDVLIIGSGYTGLHAGLVTARNGRRTHILEARYAGWGCSSRNGGQISPSIKPSLAALTTQYGPKKARAIRNEGTTSLEWIEDFIKAEAIDCDFMRSGRFHAAHTPWHFEALAKDAVKLQREEGIHSKIVPKGDQHSELGTDAYHGGVVFTRHAAIHPAKYHYGLLRNALAAGVTISEGCPAQNIKRDGDGFIVSTPMGSVSARKIIIATNGYTTDLVPWLARRVIPIGTYMIATEPLPSALMDKLFPKNRVVSDTCKVIYYYRPSPDRTRILFGGRVSADETNPQISGPKLKADMCRIFPELASYDYTHSWTGTVAFSFDKLAHMGAHQGIHYAMGYCGSGIGMASYLGMRLGQQLIGDPAGATAFDDLTFQTRPLYTGKPWFLPAVVGWYRWRDQQDLRRAARTS